MPAPGPDWTAITIAIATAIGAGAAVTAVIVAALPYRRDVAQRIREQASHISTWLGPSAYEATVRNMSTEAVYDLAVRFVDTNGALIVEAIGQMPVLPPNETVKIPNADTHPTQKARQDGRQVVTEATFTDRNGVRWTRLSTGQLRRHGAN